jgi:DNA-binding winged helix-turn-helix (wHTH) protein/TolB-like protein
MKTRFGLFDFDSRTGELRRNGDVIRLQPQPARVLALLLLRPGEVVLRDDFRRELWGEDTFVDFERGLNFCILQVRIALGDSSDNPRFIQTVPRRGYRFIAPVAAARQEETTSVPGPDDLRPRAARPPSPSEPTPVPAAAFTADSTSVPATWRPPSPPAPTSVPAHGGLRWVWPATATAAVAILAAGAWLAWTQALSSGERHASSEPIRVAVLPFVNLTGDDSASGLADGLTDEVISQLGALGHNRLAVIARTSAMAYRDTKKDVRTIGAELNVRFLVEGSIRREGQAWRITTTLVTVASQTSQAQWEETFGSQPSAADNHQRHAAFRIARLAARQVVGDTPGVVPPRHVLGVGVWEGFLHATALANGGRPDDLRRAIAQLVAVVEHQPDFADAWARLAAAHHMLVMMGAVEPDAAYPAAREAAARAVALDGTLASAHLARGLVALWYEWKPESAAESFTRALALNASDAAAHHDYAWALVALGRTDEAVRHITAARDLDPVSTRASNDVGWLHLQLRQPEEAARACHQTLAIDSESLEAQACLERAYVARRLYDAALHAARTATPAATTAPAASGRTSADATAELQRLWKWRVQRLEQASRSRWVSPYTLATHYVLIGETHKAIDALETAYAARAGMLVFLARDPAMDPLRQEPRFAALLAKIKPES